MNILVLGAGSWGTAFACHCVRCDHQVTLWGRDEDLIKEIKIKRENSKYLKGIRIPREISISSDLGITKEFGELLVVAVPVSAIRELTHKVIKIISSARDLNWLSLAKGLQFKKDNFLVPTDIITEVTGSDRVFTLTGPSHAEEVARKIVTTVFIGGSNLDQVRVLVRELSHPDYFRVYGTNHLRSIQAAAALKNIIAIAEGMTYGLPNCGANTRGALFSRGMAEMRRFFQNFGLEERMLDSIAGAGDLKTTGGSTHSRNRRYGELIAQGKKPNKGRINGMVVEGYYTVAEVKRLIEQKRIEMPITEQLYKVLYKGLTPREGISNLLAREPKMITGPS